MEAPMPETDRRKKNSRRRKNIRDLALNIIQDVHKGGIGGAPLPVLIASAGCKGLEKAFLTDEVYGVLRLKSPLDTVLMRYLSRPSALSTLLRQILRMGVHELLFMDYVPAHASVNEMAALARSRAGAGGAGLVNAVLRKVAESAGKIREELEQSRYHVEGTEDIAAAASIPEWLAKRWIDCYGMAASAELARSLVCVPEPCWRVNMMREGAQDLLSEWQDKGRPCGRHGFYFSASKRDAAQWDMLEHMEENGLISRQGAGSQLVAERIAQYLQDAGLLQAGLWDCCCGRGGKTSALMEQGVHIALASDAAEFRVADLKDNAERLGLSCPTCLCGRAQDVEGLFPSILLDAPCSGTGTLARNPELRLRISEKSLEQAACLQKELLESVWKKLLPGGSLFYATCALNREENEGQAERFLQVSPDAELLGMETVMPLSPGQDALFLAVIRKAKG